MAPPDSRDTVLIQSDDSEIVFLDNLITFLAKKKIGEQLASVKVTFCLGTPSIELKSLKWWV